MFGMCDRVKKRSRTRNHTNGGVISRSACVVGHRKHADHEQRCHFVFGMCGRVKKRSRTRNHTNEGVISCLVSGRA